MTVWVNDDCTVEDQEALSSEVIDPRSDGGLPDAPLWAFPAPAVHQIGFQSWGLSGISRCFSFPGCMSRTGCQSPMSPIISPAQRFCKYGARSIGGRMGCPELGRWESFFIRLFCRFLDPKLIIRVSVIRFG